MAHRPAASARPLVALALAAAGLAGEIVVPFSKETFATFEVK